MKQSHFICLFYLLLLTAQVGAFQGWMLVSGSRILGEEFYVSCSYLPLPSEEVDYVYIWPSSVIQNVQLFYFMITDQGDVYLGQGYHSRLSVTVNSTTVTETTNIVKTATMKIANLQCSDEHDYGCSFHYRTPYEITINSYMISQMLIIRAPPSPPVVILETSSPQAQENTTRLFESSTIVVRCKADVGRPELGSLHWRVFRQNGIENIGEDDIRVRTVAQEMINCTELLEQTLTMKVTRSDQNMRVICFVQNADFPVGDITMHCQNRSSLVCGKTPEFSVYSLSGYDDLSTFIIGGVLLVAGFLTAVLVDIVYHCIVKPRRSSSKRPPSKTPSPVDKHSYNSEEVEEAESMAEDESVFSSRV